jgi:hypothetical protein
MSRLSFNSPLAGTFAKSGAGILAAIYSLFAPGCEVEIPLLCQYIGLSVLVSLSTQ